MIGVAIALFTLTIITLGGIFYISEVLDNYYEERKTK